MSIHDAFRSGRRETSAHDILVVDDAERIAQEWRRLEETGHATPFQSRAWLDPWYRIVAPAAGARPLFVLVRERRSAEPQMLLPLCVRRDDRRDVIEFADLGVSDYNAPLLGQGFAPSRAQFADLWSQIRGALPRADVFRIDKSPERIGGAANPFLHLSAMYAVSLGAWAAPLPASRDLYDRNVIDPSFFRELQRKTRRLNGRGAVSFGRVLDAEHARRVFAAIGEMRGARFSELGRTNILAASSFNAFYQAVIDESLGDFANLYTLEVDGEVVAANFTLRYADSLSFLLSGFRDGEWKSCSLGNLSVDRMITAAIEDGVTSFDFTIGNSSSKTEFGAQRTMLYAGAHALSFRAMRQATESRLKSVVRSFISPDAPPASTRRVAVDQSG